MYCAIVLLAPKNGYSLRKSLRVFRAIQTIVPHDQFSLSNYVLKAKLKKKMFSIVAFTSNIVKNKKRIMRVRALQITRENKDIFCLILGALIRWVQPIIQVKPQSCHT